MAPAIPLSTYRLQLTADFDFDAAATVVPYLKALGISHVYASPFLKARSGSTHGYDIVDHNQFNPELGGEAGFERLSAALRRHDLGLILDFVPNHMGVHFVDNPWWLDVLEWGEVSPHARAFDIDWELLPFRARGGVLLPILGRSYGAALESGDIALRFDAAEGSFSAWYYEHRLPIAPERYGDILRAVVSETGSDETPAGRALLALADRTRGLRRPNYREAPAFKRELAAIAGSAALIARGLDAYRAGPDRPGPTLALHRLLERQHYRLGHWRLASSEINYRRFFDVNTLAGLRVEDAGTFVAIHQLVRRLIADGKLQGLRLDHIDGLRDPAQYAQRLQRLIRSARNSSEPFYVLIEKILGEHEELRSLPGIDGTTGYEWLNAISQVLVDGKGLGGLDETWRQISSTAPDITPVLMDAKRRVLETLLTSEFTVLTRLLARIAAGHFSTRDFSADSLRQAFELYVLHFPVYRTYLTASRANDVDRALITQAIEKARADWFGADEGLFDFLRDALTLDLIGPGRALHSKPRVRRFALKVQQFTGPMMAKALEDTSFYRFHRLLALNEVGGDPAAPAMTIDDFHARMKERAMHSPHGLTTTATHDTKRGEDARARILALAEMPGEWAAAVARWKLLNASHLTLDGPFRSPSATFEYMLYQSLLGAWPDVPNKDFLQRMQAFALKAAREGKEETSWLNPNKAYEDGLARYLERILDPDLSGEFLASFRAFAERVSLLGALNSLSQITLKAMLPGVPDFYQGTESWDLSLVDPDNRRPVDFEWRRQALADVARQPIADLAPRWRDGRIKLAWTRALLHIRNAHPEIFTSGSYLPVAVDGADRDHVIAFARRSGRTAVVVAALRHFAPFTEAGRRWPDFSPLDATIDVAGYPVEGQDRARTLALGPLLGSMPAVVLPARATRARASRA